MSVPILMFLMNILTPDLALLMRSGWDLLIFNLPRDVHLVRGMCSGVNLLTPMVKDLGVVNREP